MSVFKRRERRNKVERTQTKSGGPKAGPRKSAAELLQGLASFDSLEQRVLFSVLPAPTGFAAVSPSSNEVDLSWNNSSGETGYIVQYETAATPSPGTWTNLTTVPTNTTSFAVTSVPTTTGTTTTNGPLSAGTAYSFRLVAVDADGNSPASTTATATTQPATPTITTSVTVPNSITVNWTAVTGATSYVLQRSTDLATWTTSATLTIVSPATTPPVTYTDTTGLSANTTYYYRLAAVDASGQGSYSNAVAATTQLPAPTGVTATALSTTQIAIAWPSEAGAFGYTLQQQSGTGQSATWANVTGASSISGSSNLFVVGNLTANTSYTFRLLATNSSGQSAPSSTVTTSTLLAAPVLTSAAGSTTTNVLSWTAVPGATGYVLQGSADDSVWSTIATPISTATSFTDTGAITDGSGALLPDTQYFYRLAAVNAGGNSAYSPVVAQTTNITANSAVTATSASSYSITVGWAAQPTASGFKVMVEGGTTQSPTWTQVGDIIPAGSTSYTITGLTPNTAYSYRLITENEGGDSAASATATATTRIARTRVTGSATSDTTVVLNWTNITGNNGYKVEASVDGSTWVTVTTTAANATTYTVSSIPTTPNATPLVADTAYYFRVQGTNANGDASPSNVLTRTTLLAAPAGLAATSPSTTGLTLGWTDDTGNAGYVVQKEIHSTWKTIATLATGVDTDVITGLHAGNNYNFQVLAIDGGGFSAPATVVGTTLPKSTVVTAVGASPTSITVTWVPIPGVTSYDVETSPDGTTWTPNTVAAGTTTFTDTSPSAANTQMYYKVGGIDAGGNGAYSAVATTYSLLAAPTTFTATSLSDTSISLSWDAQTNVTGFRLEKQGGTTQSPTWTQVGKLLPGSSTSYIVPNITANTAYTFRLIAVNGGGDSAPSASATATTKVPAPVIALTTFTDTSVGLTWPAVPNATGYKVLRSTTPDTGFSFLANATVPSSATAPITFTDSTAVQGTQYYYEVTATNTGGGDSLASNVIAQTTLMTAPTGLTAVSSETTSIDLSWTAVAGATGYIVQQQSGTTWTQVGSTLPGQADSLNVSSLVSGTSYTFRILAVDAAGNSLPSATATTSTLLAAPVATAAAVSTTSTSITWPSITGATSYIVQRSLDSGTWTQIGTPTAATGTTQTYADSTGLSAGTEYFYRVVAVNAGGNSQFSNVTSTTTLLAAPTSVVATSLSSSSIGLAWAAQPTAVGFIVQQQGGTTAAPTWTQVGDVVAAGSTGVTLTGLTLNTAYTYRVIAVDDGGNSIASASVTATTSTGVTKLKVTPLSDTAIALAWNTVTAATGYKIYYSTGGGSFSLLSTAGATTTGYTASGLTANTAYSFYVTCTGAGAESAPSNTMNTGTLLSPPTTFAIAADTTNPTTSLDLSWDQSTGNVGYLVQKLVGTVWTNVTTTSTGTNAYVATGLLPGVSYTYRVCALSTIGTSLPSTSATLATT